MSYSDTSALESMTNARNYNSYIFNLVKSNTKNFGKILDFGAGYGEFSKYLKSENRDIFAYEVDEEALDKLKHNNIKTVSDLNNIKVDNIVSLNVLEHIKEDKKVVKELEKILYENGRMVIFVPASMLVWTNLDVQVNHQRRYSKKGLIDLFSNTNLKIVKVHYVDFIGWITLLLSKILRLKLKFNKKQVGFYDKFIFNNFKKLDVLFKNIIGKNLLIVLEKE